MRLFLLDVGDCDQDSVGMLAHWEAKRAFHLVLVRRHHDCVDAPDFQEKK